MIHDGKILIGKSEGEGVYIYPKMANRHGMICGATGTGKSCFVDSIVLSMIYKYSPEEIQFIMIDSN